MTLPNPEDWQTDIRLREHAAGSHRLLVYAILANVIFWVGVGIWLVS